jgi:hypothetical protein
MYFRVLIHIGIAGLRPLEQDEISPSRAHMNALGGPGWKLCHYIKAYENLKQINKIKTSEEAVFVKLHFAK